MSTGSRKIDFAEVKRCVSMEQVVAHLGIVGLKPKGSGQWKGACPFCKAADCFAVSNAGGREKSGAFNCFKCPAGGDQIQLDHNIFTAAGLVGALAAAAFKTIGGGGVVDTDDRIIFNSSNGQLFYDADGSGAQAAQQIATINPGTALALTEAHFLII